jgi:hypothetical protein
MPATAAELEQAVAAEMARYGSRDLAIDGLWNDACGARPDAFVHEVLREALRLRSAQQPSEKRAA